MSSPPTSLQGLGEILTHVLDAGAAEAGDGLGGLRDQLGHHVKHLLEHELHAPLTLRRA